MKTLTIRNIVAVVVMVSAVLFAVAAVIYIVHLTQAGLINWKN